MSVPRRSREVHAESVDVTTVPPGTFEQIRKNPAGLSDAARKAIARRWLARAAVDEPHTPGVAECVCEEPCRYCRCEPS